MPTLQGCDEASTVMASTIGGNDMANYSVDSLDEEFWSRVFGCEVAASEPGRIGSGQVGMNLRFALTSDNPDVPSSVVVKLASDDPTSRATGVALRNYEREAKFYQEIADTVDVRAPHCYFADWIAESGDTALVLEDMSPAEQGDQIDGCSIALAQVAVNQLTKLHGPRWADASLDSIDWLQRRDLDGSAQLMGIYGAVKAGFMSTYEDLLRETAGDAGVAFVDKLHELLPAYVESMSPPFTVTHGDFRLDNLLFGEHLGGVPCAVVDWQTPGQGNGLMDLGYFIGAGLLPEARREAEWDLLNQYIAGVESYGNSVDKNWAERCYRIGGLSGFIMAVVASQIVGRTERGDAMFGAMASRHLLQCIENGSLDLLD